MVRQPGSVYLPTLNQKATGGDPIHPPVGGFYTELERKNVKEPSRAFRVNVAMAQKRALSTVPEEAMVPSVHSYFWGMKV